MVERRDHVRFVSELRITFSTTDFSSNVRSDAYLMDCSRTGAKIICPVYYEIGGGVEIEIVSLKGTLAVRGKVLDCREDPKQAYRFDRTFVVNMQFDPLSDDEWNDLVSLAKKI